MTLEPQNDYLDGLSKITNDIVKKSASGDYIYRGEPEHYEEYNEQISSSLYRLYEPGQFDIKDIQKEILEEARNYIHEREKSDFEILTELQHYGSQTNLIDFTTDYHIALFFACDGGHDKDGRIILLEKNEQITKKYQITKPQNPQSRVTAQKSVFVQPSTGFIDPNDVITIPIPAALKQWILIHLLKFQDISTQTIYNDLHGFIRHKNLRSSRDAILPLVLAQLTMERTPAEKLTADERQSQLQKMIAAYTTKIQYSPYDASTYVKQGNCYAEIQEFDCAIETFSKAILLNSNYTVAYFNRGVAYQSKGQVDCAIEDYTKAIQLNSDYADAYYNRGVIYSHKGEYDRTIEDYTKAIELKPDYAETYYNRGLAYIHKGEVNRAIEDYTKAIELKSDYADAYHDRGVIYSYKGEYDRATEDYTKAIELKPDYAKTYHNRGLAYVHKGEVDRAIEDYNTAIELNPDYADAYHDRGLAYSKKGEADRAFNDLNRAIQLDPNNHEFLGTRDTIQQTLHGN